MIPSSRSRTFFFFGLPDNPRRRLSHVCVRRCEGSPPHSLFHRHLSAPPPPPTAAGELHPQRARLVPVDQLAGGLFWIQRECFSPIQLRRTKTITRGAFKSPSKNREKNQTALTVFLGLLVLVFHPEFTAKLYWHSQTTLQAGFVRLFFISGVLSESRPGRRCFVLAFLGVFLGRGGESCEVAATAMLILYV